MKLQPNKHGKMALNVIRNGGIDAHLDYSDLQVVTCMVSRSSYRMLCVWEGGRGGGTVLGQLENLQLIFLTRLSQWLGCEAV